MQGKAPEELSRSRDALLPGMDRKKIIFISFVIPWASLLVAILLFISVRAGADSVKNRIMLHARSGASSTQSASIKVRTEVNGEIKENIEIYENQKKSVEYKNITQDEASRIETRVEIKRGAGSSSPRFFDAYSERSADRENEHNQLKARPVLLEEKSESSETSERERIQTSHRDESASSSASKSEPRRFQQIFSFWQDMARRIFSLFRF